jgi:metal-sulfur cluster biosynthetic enzyme|tara:strand:+ start:144 stop:443 length:300 start_codon:yes stop_codon:yes gene_type:complete
MPFDQKSIREKLKEVIDPEMGISIIDLGLVYDIKIDKKVVNVDMTLTSPMCPVGPFIIDEVRKSITELGAEIVNVNLVWEPAWNVENLSDEIKIQLGML